MGCARSFEAQAKLRSLAPNAHPRTTLVTALASVFRLSEKNCKCETDRFADAFGAFVLTRAVFAHTYPKRRASDVHVLVIHRGTSVSVCVHTRHMLYLQSRHQAPSVHCPALV